MSMLTFGQSDKENPGGRIPIALSYKLRSLAIEQRRSLSSVLTEVIARGIGEDPSNYGIYPKDSKEKEIS